MPQTEKQNVGNIGENVACQFLEKQGFRIVERNYRKKWGGIDIVAEKDKILHFVEVKTITSKGDYLPEDNVRLWKKQRLSRAIRTYLAERRIPDEQEFEIDVVSVVIDTETGHQKIKLIGNIILD